MALAKLFGVVEKRPTRWRLVLGVISILWIQVAANLEAADTNKATFDAAIHPDRPYAVSVAPRTAKFIRVTIDRSSRNQPCIDELEVYAPAGNTNLALASAAAKATASSCLPGYDIHQVSHLNDGHYGNSHSWIAASSEDEWAQIQLPQATEVERIVISRDRDGKYHDRIPVAFTIQFSLDGRAWDTVARVEAKAAVPARPQSHYHGPFQLTEDPTWDELLKYAFKCERHTWRRISAEDHLSPLQAERPAVPGGSPYWGRIARLDPLDRTLVQMDEMLARLNAKSLEVSREHAELVGLRRRRRELSEAQSLDSNRGTALYYDTRLAKRRLMLRDPELVEGLRRILFVKRHPYHASHNYSDILDSQFKPGGGICVLKIPCTDGRLQPSAATLNTLFDASEGIARDAVADFDGGRIYFAYRPSQSPVSGWAPYWHLQVMDADGENRQRLTEGPFHDFHPCPLPDGDLAFISTRVKARFLCWRPQAFVLFRMEADGSRLQPLSHANLSEWTPTMMRDGRILWTRSEYVDKGADFGHTLWAIRPDGTHPELVFGNNTPNCYINGHEVPGTHEILCTLFSHGGDHNGPIGLIDQTKGPFDIAAVTNITPDVTPHYNMSWPRYECFRDPVPISRDYFLVSHAPADRFGLYVIDRYGNRELLYIDPQIGSMCPTPLRPRPRPPVLPSTVDSELADAGKARLALADVYEGLAPHVQPGEVKYLRICEEVRAELETLPDGECRSDHQPFQDWYATPIHKVSGPHGWPSYVAKASHGLVPVSEDGSATFEVPAEKVLYFEVLDAEFNELQRMRSVLQLQPGEQRSCIGCHEDRQSTPLPQQVVAGTEDAASPESPPWGDQPFAYERTVQPVWDAHCVQCHDGSDEHGIDLTGTLDTEKIPASYRTLISGGWVHYFDYTYGLRHHKAAPKTFGTIRSKLWKVLDSGHYDVRLSEPEMRAVKCWIDLNCPLWPDYQFRPERSAARPDKLAGPQTQ